MEEITDGLAVAHDSGDAVDADGVATSAIPVANKSPRSTELSSV